MMAQSVWEGYGSLKQTRGLEEEGMFENVTEKAPIIFTETNIYRQEERV